MTAIVAPINVGHISFPAHSTLDDLFDSIRDRVLRMAGMSNAVEDKFLDHAFGDGAWTVTAPTYIALTTVIVDDTMTAATITEATYTGYARKSLAAADVSAASGGAKTNSAAQTFAACTGGSSTVIGFAIVSSSAGAGDVIFYGTLASTVISTTQTPATFGIGDLDWTAD